MKVKGLFKGANYGDKFILRGKNKNGNPRYVIFEKIIISIDYRLPDWPKIPCAMVSNSYSAWTVDLDGRVTWGTLEPYRDDVVAKC